MEKQKRWHFYLILAVMILTLYNILPTVFYYSKPLKSPIDAKRAETVSNQIISRVNELEDDSKSWLEDFTKHLGIHPKSISFNKADPGVFEIAFKDIHDANLFKQFLPRAGSLIPFVPAQLELDPTTAPETSDKVVVLRQVNVYLEPSESKKLFQYVPKMTKGNISKGYRALINDRVSQLALAFGGDSKNAVQISAIVRNTSDTSFDDLTVSVAKEIVDIETTLGSNHPIAKRYFASFSQTDDSDRANMMQQFLTQMDATKGRINQTREPLAAEQKKVEEKGEFLNPSTAQRLSTLDGQISALTKASEIIRQNSTAFNAGKAPLTLKEIQTQLTKSQKSMDPKEPIQVINLQNSNPLVEALVIDWGNDRIELQLYDDVEKLRLNLDKNEEIAYQRDKLNQYLINDIARASRTSDENIAPERDGFAVALSTLTNPQSFLTMNLGYVAGKQSRQMVDRLQGDWTPKHADLVREVFPVNDYATYKKMSSEDQRLGLVVYAPAMHSEIPPKGFKTDSIYVIARGLENIIQKYEASPDAPTAEQLKADFGKLNRLLQKNGFIGYPGSSYGVAKEFQNDYIFELDDYYSTLINATRENFSARGSKRYAVLPFTDVEQRIITLNNIDDEIQEDLLKWRDEYSSAQVDLNVTRKYEVPPPTKNPMIENVKLGMVKYFRGDDRKILKWGLDLSGGKTVRIGLRDSNNQIVTDPEDLNQAVNELYTRINKMGVSERTIRIENNNIILDFPGSQALSAQELVKASAMYFHIVNEKFTPNNPQLRDDVNQFLQDIWNEAVVTNRKDVESINEIAWQHLGGEAQGVRARSDSAKNLFDKGLRVANPKDSKTSHTFNDTLSKIAVQRGDDYSAWQGQTHPLITVFNNYALEGSNLTNIQAGYDPTEGNILTFSVKRSYDRGEGSPREDFHNWTSQFSEDRIAGTPKEAYSQGRGWRMAVILNDTITTMPNLRAALRDGGTISGRFSQREVAQLSADLKAGSLSFTPRILSEQNVSPELGETERAKGLSAALVGLILVAVAMIGYYRFAGLIAFCAVMLNLLIMWGVLQNLDAALTLPGIAGIVLTIGMAVDANVLVFERIREEFQISGRIASAIQAGYNKAFTAILDSNITTIIAALILIQFDSGPIKGFAVTLIIGLTSSMFTALFVTRYFFAGWVRNPKNTKLNMSHWIGETKIDFLKWAKPAVTASLVLMIAGGYLFYNQRNVLFGMDFTGGYSLTLDLEEKAGETGYQDIASNAILTKGAFPVDFQIQELSKPNQLRIQLGMGMEEPGHPFHGMPEILKEGPFTYEFQSNPRITWVVDALASAGLSVQQSDLDTLNKDWTMMSGQFSETMRDNALMALTIALISILIYITFRFEFKYAIAAVIALTHDVLITLGILAIFRYAGFAVQIDLEVVGAIMTIIGYSLNDTIIVFDRIREDIKVLRKLKFSEIINHAINITLSRTLMTSGTTLLVLLSLVLLGGQAIFDFSLVMTIGVIVGTFSSLFIAGPAMLYFHNREERSLEPSKV